MRPNDVAASGYCAGLSKLTCAGDAATATSPSAYGNPQLDRLLQRRPTNVAALAQANKMARQIWPLLTHGRIYEPKHGVLEAAATPA